ncbi:glutathione-disulfide reductase [Asticcacaulis sp. YBE204]|uniref:glutathione-disulfide reductase n=1 Tax=Asticcacaulis sp. YBE204 TaxID=1282363 RepID=UPI0003C40F68|nr:glutathione-disulfide reductase [Asticcacaulis sp. YBE204]ESQ78280.1 NADPH-glutathione reductase [Asticcacaulis sp. YBE204]
MSDYDYDLFVLGAGSGGVRAARLSAQLGLKVAVAEEDKAGGTCVLRGCVPKKFMVYASEVPEQIAYARGLGWEAQSGKFDWVKFRNANTTEVNRLSDIYASNLVKAGADLINARAKLTGEHTVHLTPSNGDEPYEVTAKTILIAVGGHPFVPDDVEGKELAITSNEMFHLEKLPKSIAIVGGGYIAVEFAGVLNGWGVETHILYRGDQILRAFDQEVREHLTQEMGKKGIRIMTHAEPKSLVQVEDGIKVTLTDDTELTVETVLYATGRRPHTRNLGLEEIGVGLDRDGAVVVDKFSKTAIDHIYAVGDVTNRCNLTPVAIREGVAFVETAFKNNPQAYDHGQIATAVFSQPQIGTVGLTEQDAVAQGIRVDIYTARFKTMKTAFVGGDNRTLMKLIVDHKTDVVLGVHMVGPDSAEIIQMAGIAVKAGLTKAQWDATCAVHPTAAEEFVTLREKRTA